MGYNALDVFRRSPSRDGRGCRTAVDFVVCFGCGSISCVFFLFFLRTHTACCKYEAALPHYLPTTNSGLRVIILILSIAINSYLLLTTIHTCVFPNGSVRFGAVNRTAPNRWIFALVKTAPHHIAPLVLRYCKTAPNRTTVGLKIAPNRAVGFTTSEKQHRTAP